MNYGPHLVRVTRRDMQRWMPTVLPAKPLVLDPDPALQELLEAIRKGGREAYRRLLEVLRELKRLESGTTMFKQALAELSRAQGVVLGNVGVYLDASVDPETLTHSEAALAGGTRTRCCARARPRGPVQVTLEVGALGSASTGRHDHHVAAVHDHVRRFLQRDCCGARDVDGVPTWVETKLPVHDRVRHATGISGVGGRRSRGGFRTKHRAVHPEVAQHVGRV